MRNDFIEKMYEFNYRICATLTFLINIFNPLNHLTHEFSYGYLKLY